MDRLFGVRDRVLSFQAATANGDFQFASTIASELEGKNLRIQIGGAGASIIVIDENKKGVDIAFMIEARNAARKAKNFKEADRIRDELAAQGIVLKDNADGTTTPEFKR